MPQILTMDGKYRLSGGDLAEMAARWHAAHPQSDAVFLPTPRKSADCVHRAHWQCSGVMSRVEGALDSWNVIDCGCDCHEEVSA